MTSTTGGDQTSAAIHRRVEHVMGMPISLALRGRHADSSASLDAWQAVLDELREVDAVFSTYRDDSDISRIRRGELTPADADPTVAVVLELCVRAQSATRGAFTAMPHGRLDPTGLVKGWAIERASEILRRHGSHNHAVNGGGDMQLAGEAAPGRAWVVGITDPNDQFGVSTVVTGRDFAVATSGTAERGQHIIDPFTGRPATVWVSATVVGASLTWADVYATAAFVTGRHTHTWIEGTGYAAYAVDRAGAVWSSADWRAIAQS